MIPAALDQFVHACLSADWLAQAAVARLQPLIQWTANLNDCCLRVIRVSRDGQLRSDRQVSMLYSNYQLATSLSMSGDAVEALHMVKAIADHVAVYRPRMADSVVRDTQRAAPATTPPTDATGERVAQVVQAVTGIPAYDAVMGRLPPDQRLGGGSRTLKIPIIRSNRTRKTGRRRVKRNRTVRSDKN